MSTYRFANRKKIDARMIQFRKENAIKWLWNQIKRRRDVLAITREVFIATFTVPNICPVLGIPISYELDRDNFPSVDRIDSNKPYELGNIAIISYRANMIKSVGSAKEHSAIAAWLISQGRAETSGKKLPALGSKEIP